MEGKMFQRVKGFSNNFFGSSRRNLNWSILSSCHITQVGTRDRRKLYVYICVTSHHTWPIVCVVGNDHVAEASLLVVLGWLSVSNPTPI